MSQRLAMTVSLCPQRRIHAIKVGIALPRDSRHVIKRMAQTGITPTSHHHHSAFATLLCDGGDPTVRAQQLIVSFGQGLALLPQRAKP
jgi:hypothetical protein